MTDELSPEQLERLLDALAERVARRLDAARCAHCRELVPSEVDPCLRCAACGTDLVVLRAFDQVHVFDRDRLPTGADLVDLLHHLGELSEGRRREARA